MSIFDVVDLHVSHRKSRSFVLGEPAPPLFTGKLPADEPSVLEAQCAAAAHPLPLPKAPGTVPSVRAEVYAVWGLWFVCTAIPPGTSLHQPGALHATIPFACDKCFLALFVTFPCMCVDVFCKCVVYGRARRWVVAAYAVAVLGMVVTVQHQCLLAAHVRSDSNVACFCAALAAAAAAQVLAARAHDGERSAAQRALPCVFAGAGTLTACSALTAIVAYSARGDAEQQYAFHVQRTLLLSAIVLYAGGTVLTLAPVVFLCSHLHAAS